MKRLIRIVFFIFVIFFSETSFSISTVPGSAEPGLVKQNYLPTSLRAPPKTTPTIQRKEQKVTPLGKEAEKITFTLNKIILKGNHVYTDAQLLEIYKSSLHKKISVLDLQNIVQDITNYYRNNGYILSRAILPPQKISNGVVRVDVIEGYIHKVHVIGTPRGATSLIQAYGDQIAAVKPAQEKVMERYLLLANAVAGAEVKAVLEPSATEVGAADLNLVVEEQPLNPFFSYDNYGTRYLGPHQLTARVAANSIFIPGDSTSFTYLSTDDGRELRFGDLNYLTYLGNDGLLLTLDANKSITFPGFLLRQLITRGTAITYTISLQYPIIQQRDKTLTIDGNFAYLNSTTTQFHTLIYSDHIRPAQIGATYSFSDSYRGSNVFALHLMHGFNIMNASNDPDSFFTSRFGADGIFTKWNAQASRNQALFDRFSAFFIAQGQYSYDPLLVEEQFAFGGSQLGRGYDPAEILGDRGFAGSVELRMDNYPDLFQFKYIQMYAFYDAGVIWNINAKDLPFFITKQSATSTGLGMRFGISSTINGNVMVTQPLTKQVSAEELVGKGKCPRVFFSVSAAL